MQRELAIIEHSLVTISEKHAHIMPYIKQEQSERLSEAIVALMETMEEIENEHLNQS